MHLEGRLSTTATLAKMIKQQVHRLMRPVLQHNSITTPSTTLFYCKIPMYKAVTADCCNVLYAEHMKSDQTKCLAFCLGFSLFHPFSPKSRKLEASSDPNSCVQYHLLIPFCVAKCKAMFHGDIKAEIRNPSCHGFSAH